MNQSHVTPEKSRSHGAAGEAMGRAPNTHSPQLKSAEMPEDGWYHEDCGSMWEVTACSWVLLHLPTNGEDHLERQLGSDPRIWGFDPHQRALTAARALCGEAKRSIYRLRYYQHSFIAQSVSPAAEGEDKMGSNVTGKQQEHSETGLPPLSHGLRAHATLLIPRDLPLLSLLLLCLLPPLLFPPQCAGPARSPSRV